jgi:hypothetical protein
VWVHAAARFFRASALGKEGHYARACQAQFGYTDVDREAAVESHNSAGLTSGGREEEK